MFAPAVGPRRPRAVAAPEVEAAVVEAPDAGLDTTDLSLAEFVIDDDDYPEVTAAPRLLAAASEPDRVDDIDEWLEEFAVPDSL